MSEGASQFEAAATGLGPGVVPIVGGVMQFMGTLKQGMAEAEAANYNAAKKEKYASLVVAEGEENARRQMIQARMSIGAGQAAYGASGVQQDGSVADVLAQSAANAELDHQTIKLQASQKATMIREDAKRDRARGSSAMDNAEWNAAATMLQTGSKLANSYGGD